MGHSVVKAICMIAYIAFLLFLIDFKIHLILDFKALLQLFTGTALLFLCGFKKRMNRYDIMRQVKTSLLISGFLISFLLLVQYLSQETYKSHDQHITLITNFLPLCYSLIVYLCIDIFFSPSPKEEQMKKKKSIAFLEWGLTAREAEIAADIIEGLLNKEIADKYCISESTVKKHIQNIYRKLNVTNRTGFIEMVLKNTRDG